MKKLELKHVQNYLDASIKCIYKGDKYNVVKCSRNWIWIINQENALLKLKYSEVKLILRPLSDLTKEIEVNGEKFIPTFKTGMENEEFSILKELKYTLALDVRGGHIYQHQFQKLIEWHFDVFGLN